MNSNLLAKSIGIPTEEVEQLLGLGQAQLYQSQRYLALVDTLDYEVLSGSLAKVRAVYDLHLPELVDHLRQEHNFTGKPMTATTLSNWILGFLHNPAYLNKLPDFHQNVPLNVLNIGLPDILGMLDEVGPEGREWQRAMALLSLPLFAAA